MKRKVDRAVCMGRDIPDALTLYNVLKDEDSLVQVHFVRSEDINTLEKATDVPAMKAIPGTMKLHQLHTDCRGEVAYRSELSVAFAQDQPFAAAITYAARTSFRNDSLC